MKKLLTRGLLGIAALAIPAGAAVALPMAANAAPAGGSITATNSWANPTGGTINGNLDVPAGVTVHLNGAEVTGNVTVEGTLQAANTHFDKNVIVNGGAFQFVNQPTLPSVIKGNLNVTTSPASDGSGFWVPTVIDGNFNFTGSTAMVFGSPTTVGGQTNINTY
jgi:hypothetical protein